MNCSRKNYCDLATNNTDEKSMNIRELEHNISIELLTSIEAFEKIKDKIRPMQYLVLLSLKEFKKTTGLNPTTKEIQSITRLNPITQRPRLTELKEMGLIRSHPTEKRLDCTTKILTPAGILAIGDKKLSEYKQINYYKPQEATELYMRFIRKALKDYNVYHVETNARNNQVYYK